MSEILDTQQKSAVEKWISEGASLSEIQKRLNSEFKVSITYIELRFLVDDLNLTPKDKIPPPPPVVPQNTATSPKKGSSHNVNDMLIEDEPLENSQSNSEEGNYPEEATNEDAGNFDGIEEDYSAATGKVSVTMDAIQRPGELASGSVTFSDGKTGQWFIDSYQRLGFEPPYKGYQPTQQDVIQFQELLKKEFSKGGY